MTLHETAALLHMLKAAYPNLLLEPENARLGIPGTTKIWFQALRSYPQADCVAALDHYRIHEPKREFAPGLFDFESEVRAVVKARTDEQGRKLALSWTNKDTENPYLEEYKREVVVGRDKKGLPIIEMKTYLRQTKERRAQIDREMEAKGYTKEITPMFNGWSSYCYRRPSTFGRPAGDLNSLISEIAKPMPKAEAWLGERHDWEGTFRELDEIARISSTPGKPIGPEDYETKE